MNEILFFISIIVTFSTLLFVYKHFSKTGLACWVCFASVFANLIVIKTVNCFGLNTTLGNVLFGSVFLSLDIVAEKYDKKEANKIIWLGLITNIAFVVASQFTLLYKPSSLDYSSDAFKTVFSITPRVCLGSVSAYAFGNFLNTFIFDKLKQKQGSKLLWLRNSLSTCIAQLLDNFVLHIIAFLGILSFSEITTLSFNVWIIEVIVAIFSMPFLYFAKNIQD